MGSFIVAALLLASFLAVVLAGIEALVALLVSKIFNRASAKRIAFWSSAPIPLFLGAWFVLVLIAGDDGRPLNGPAVQGLAISFAILCASWIAWPFGYRLAKWTILSRRESENWV